MKNRVMNCLIEFQVYWLTHLEKKTLDRKRYTERHVDSVMMGEATPKPVTSDNGGSD